MKKWILPMLTLPLLVVSAEAQARQHKYIKQPGCSKPGYTCVLKYEAGAPFYCMISQPLRIKHARYSPRKVKEIKCAARFPAILKDQPKSEEE